MLTARLETDFRKPIMAKARVVVTARVTSIENRKIWATAVVSDAPLTDEQYATATAAPVRKSASEKDVRSQQAVAAGDNSGAKKLPSVAAAVAKSLFVANRPAAVPAQAVPAVTSAVVPAAVDDGIPTDV